MSQTLLDRISSIGEYYGLERIGEKDAFVIHCGASLMSLRITRADGQIDRLALRVTNGHNEFELFDPTKISKAERNTLVSSLLDDWPPALLCSVFQITHSELRLIVALMARPRSVPSTPRLVSIPQICMTELRSTWTQTLDRLTDINPYLTILIHNRPTLLLSLIPPPGDADENVEFDSQSDMKKRLSTVIRTVKMCSTVASFVRTDGGTVFMYRHPDYNAPVLK